MNASTKTKLINLALLLSLALPLASSFFGFDTNKVAAIGFLSSGLILTLFYREVAAERYKINRETKNRHLQELFAGETEKGDRIIFLIGGICFLIVGALLGLASLG
jgi:hypothetical protein